MSTPHKLSTFSQGGIKKTHLTPCRRIGLSRIVRPSNTPKLETKPIPVVDNNVIQCTKEVLNTSSVKANVPVLNSNLVKSRDKREPVLKPKENSRKNNLNTHKENEFDKNSIKESKSTYEKENRLQNKVNKIEKIKVTNSNCVASKSELTVTLEDNKFVKLKENVVEIKEKSKNNETVSKTLKKRLSMKKSSNSSGNFSDEDLSTLSELGNLVDNNSQILFSDDDDNEIKFKPKKRKTAICLTDDDEKDFIVSQNSFDKTRASSDGIQEETWSKRIKKTIERIEKKELQLENLKQAAIYKKLHNLNELKSLTTVWRNGCEDALRYLLNSLQEHGTMTMVNLLKNLKIPTEFITYNENDDKFVKT